jgi:spermidine synthase
MPHISNIILLGIVLMILIEYYRQRRKILYQNDKTGVIIYQKSGQRVMIFHKAPQIIQSAYDISQPIKIVLSYQKILVACLYCLPHRPQRIAIIGLGGGCLSTQVRRLFPDALIVHYEISERMLDYARRYFNFRVDDKMQFFWGDAVPLLKHWPEKHCYDLIIIDAFEGLQPLPALYSLDFCYALQSLLSSQGVILVNHLRPSSLKQAEKTYTGIFEYVSVCPPTAPLEHNHIYWLGRCGPKKPNYYGARPLINLQGLTEKFIERIFRRLEKK